MDHGSHRTSGYDPGRERAWHLSILTGAGRTACAVHDVADGMPAALFWSTGTAALSEHDLPQRPVSVSFVSLPEWSTMVPEGALLPGSEANHLALVHGGLPSGALRDEPVRSLGATCIYVHDDRDEMEVLRRYPHARALPMQAVLAQLAKVRAADRPVMLLHRSADRVDLAVADRGRLLLSNSYTARSAHDVLYYMLLALEQLQLSPERTQLHYGGSHLSDAERDLLLRYIRNAKPASTLPWLESEPNGPEAPHRWMAALEQYACAS